MLRAAAHIDLDAYPAVNAWITRLEALPSWQQAVTPMLDLMRQRGSAI